MKKSCFFSIQNYQQQCLDGVGNQLILTRCFPPFFGKKKEVANWQPLLSSIQLLL